MVAGVLRGGLALEVAGRACEEVDVVDAARHVELGGQPHRLAGLTDLLGDQIVGVLTGQRSQLGQHRGAVGRGRRRPAGQRRTRRRDGPVHIGGRRQRVVGDGLTGRGVDHLMQAATGHHRGTVDPAACHAGGNGRSHGPTLADGEQRGYAFPQREALQTRDFMVIVACDDGFRAQSLAWLTRALRTASGPSRSASTSLDPARRSSLTNLSKQIIEKLQQDGRRSYAGIGKAVGLSEAAVRQRVQRMVDAGVMQIVAVTDPMQLGFARQAMIGIRCTGDTTKVAEKLAAIESVDYVVLTAGSFDAIVEVVCEDDDDLLDLLNTQIRALPGVISTETLVYLKLVKQQYNWGTR